MQGLPGDDASVSDRQPVRSWPLMQEPRSCQLCEEKNSKRWRAGPAGPGTLCNRCGIRWYRATRRHKNKVQPTEAWLSSLLKDLPF